MNLDEVEDLAVDKNFEVFISHRGDLGTVSGRDAFEQEIRIRLTEKYQELISGLDKDNTLDVLEVEAKRVAADMEQLDSVAAFQAEFSSEDANTVIVDIVYDTANDFSIEVTP